MILAARPGVQSCGRPVLGQSGLKLTQYRSAGDVKLLVNRLRVRVFHSRLNLWKME
jgi:hypothetical protein